MNHTINHNNMIYKFTIRFTLRLLYIMFENIPCVHVASLIFSIYRCSA